MSSARGSSVNDTDFRGNSEDEEDDDGVVAVASFWTDLFPPLLCSMKFDDVADDGCFTLFRDGCLSDVDGNP